MSRFEYLDFILIEMIEVKRKLNPREVKWFEKIKTGAHMKYENRGSSSFGSE